MQSSLEKWEQLLDLKDSLFLFGVEDRLFMFDKNTCSFCEIDAPVRHVISSILNGSCFRMMREGYNHLFPGVNLDNVLDELLVLHSSRVITASDRLSRARRRKGSLVSALCLIMATDCNLRCKYCYAEGGSYGQLRKTMSTDVAKKSIDFFVENSARLKNLELSFFGGEPLMNSRVLKETVQYAEQAGLKRGKSFSFTITTNGTLLDSAMMDFLVRHDFSYVISIDGPRDTNDLCRVLPDGSGTYGTVVSRLKSFVTRYPKAEEKITLRGTFTSQTLDITRSLRHLKKLGFRDISLELANTENENFQIDEDNLEMVLKEYDRVARAYLKSVQRGDKTRFFHMHQLFFQVSQGFQRISQCGAGLGYLTVAPDGTIYPCHRLVGDSRFAMGNVYESTVSPRIRKTFEEATVNHKQECRQCWARYICGGGCHATAIQFNKDILRPYKIECELMKHRIKLGAWIYSQLESAQDGPVFVRKAFGETPSLHPT